MTLPFVLVPHPHVRLEPEVLGGSPYVVGSRVPVRRLWAYYRNGVSVETLCKRYPQLPAAALLDALAFALDNEAVMEADLAREAAALAATRQRAALAPAPQQLSLALEPVPASARAAAPSRPGLARARGGGPRTAAAAQLALAAAATPARLR